jgi:D-sedoheptulose 7-phosphate isomerase
MSLSTSPFPFAVDYFKQLANLSEQFEVTDKEGYSMSFAQGVNQAAKVVAEQTKEKPNKVIFIGNGGSAAVASHQAIDYWRNGGFRAMAFNDGALLTCIGNDFGYEQVFSKPIAMFAQPGDVIVAISSSGKSANILAGVRQGLESGCHAITLSSFKSDNPLRQLGDINFYVPTQSYGFAEIAHLSICHCILDGLMKGSLAKAETKEVFH